MFTCIADTPVTMSYSNSLFVINDADIDAEVRAKIMVVQHEIDALDKEKKAVAALTTEPNYGVAQTKQEEKTGYEILWCWGTTRDIETKADGAGPTFAETVNKTCPFSCCIGLSVNCVMCVCPEEGFREALNNNVSNIKKRQDLNTKIFACQTKIDAIKAETPKIKQEKAKQKYAQMLTVRQDIARLVLAGSRDEAELATFDRKMALFKESYGVVTDKEREDALKRSNDAWNENYERQFGNKVKAKPVMSPFAARACGAAIGNNIAQIISTID